MKMAANSHSTFTNTGTSSNKKNPKHTSATVALPSAVADFIKVEPKAIDMLSKVIIFSLEYFDSLKRNNKVNDDNSFYSNI